MIRQHIRWAKAAGLDGFIVSWKDTPILDQRLSKVIDVAESEHFGLGIIYQGLDFNRQPPPVGRVAADLAYFNSHFAARAPFHAYFPKPLVVWSGTWKYSPDEIRSVTSRAARPDEDPGVGEERGRLRATGRPRSTVTPTTGRR